MEEILTGNYAYRVIREIRVCKASVDILSYIFNCNLYKKSDKANLIFIELKKAAAEGKIVRVVFDYPKKRKPNYNAIKFFTRRFKEANFRIRYLHSGSTQHGKLVLLDKSVAVFGSHNLTSRSVVSPYDISLMSTEGGLVSKLVAYYDSIWNASIEA